MRLSIPWLLVSFNLLSLDLVVEHQKQAFVDVSCPRRVQLESRSNQPNPTRPPMTVHETWGPKWGWRKRGKSKRENELLIILILFSAVKTGTKSSLYVKQLLQIRFGTLSSLLAHLLPYSAPLSHNTTVVNEVAHMAKTPIPATPQFIHHCQSVGLHNWLCIIGGKINAIGIPTNEPNKLTTFPK